MEKDTFYEDRLQAVKDALFIGDNAHIGGAGLKDILIHCMLGDNILDIEGIFSSIVQLYREKERIIDEGGIFTVKYFETMMEPKNGMVYACLDKDLKFKMLHYGEDDWKDAFYVLPYLNAYTGWKIAFKEL